MVQFDNQYRQIKIKIVYYGPALGGKTTCLQHIHKATDPERRTKLYSLNTASDRTLFFDLLSLNLGRIRGYKLALQLYTVPGQVQYNATRRAVLSGADGVVFVADSEVHQRQANTESLSNLWDNLLANGIDRETIPIILQYNKRDLSPLLPIEQLNEDLNADDFPCFPTVAVTGVGVMEGFSEVAQATLAAVASKLGVGSNQQAIARLQEQVKAAIEPYVAEQEEPEAAAAVSQPQAEVAVYRPEQDTSPETPMSQEVLVNEAVKANIAMTDLNTQLDATRQQLERKVRVLEGIADFSWTIAGERDVAGVLRLLVKKTVSLLRVQATVVLVVPGSGRIREAALHGVKKDPFLHTSDEVGEPLALGLVARREPIVVSPEQEDAGHDVSMLQGAVEAAGFSSALVAPMIAQDRIVGLLTIYATARRQALDSEDLKLAMVLASSAGIGYANTLAWQRLEDLNRELEEQVSERTRQLRSSLSEKARLADDLAEKNNLLEDAYRDLSELDHIKNELITRISHELKTPVTSLLTAAKILHRQRDQPLDKSARFLGIIRDEAEKLTEIIDTAFQASVLASTRRGFERKSLQVEDLLRNAMVPLRDLAREREIRVQVLSAGGLNAVACDPDTMQAAVRAVIKNAIEFNQKGGEVKIEVRRVLRHDEPWLTLKVSDTGIGIPEQDQQQIFETFWQGGNVLTGKPRGVGLGLTIAKRVVENHGGTISFTSTMGKGTEMTIEVPEEAPTPPAGT